MRRKVIILVVSVVLVAALQCFATVYTRGVVDNASAVLAEMETAVFSEDWEQAQSLMEPLSQSWHNACNPMDWWVSRSMTDEVHCALRELAIAVDVQDFHEARVLLAELRDTLRDLAQWDELSLSNVV
ncbi:hypothetical protein FACS1894184_01210 [Clostridia bacterium]|nr:hypothetical protein FACS1894184_01210 [Clostridia bacterium]